MVEKIGDFSAETQELIKLAACIGNKFDLRALVVASQRLQQEIMKRLFPLLKENLIIPLDESYKIAQNFQLWLSAIKLSVKVF